MTLPDEFIWIQDAQKQYQRSREWLDKQIAEKRLSVAKIPGDRRVFLVRAELEALLRPQIVQQAENDRVG
jgi:hypothetical protein